jgi:hypothetical protein
MESDREHAKRCGDCARAVREVDARHKGLLRFARDEQGRIVRLIAWMADYPGSDPT